MPHIKNNLPNQLNDILTKVNKKYPDLARQIVLSLLLTDKEKIFEQIDCILAVVSIKEFNLVKNKE